MKIGRRYPDLSFRIDVWVYQNPPKDWTHDGLAKYVAKLKKRFYSESTLYIDILINMQSRLPRPLQKKLPDYKTWNNICRKARRYG